MLIERRKNFRDCSSADTLRIADYLCHGNPHVRPIFECVKVFVRLHHSGAFTYARHPHHLGTEVVTAYDVSSKIQDDHRREAVNEALAVVEESFSGSWPFAAGSSSWVLLEILHPSIQINGGINESAVIFRKAVRLSAKGEQTETPLLERIFSTIQMPQTKEGWNFVVDPKVELANTSGSGIFTVLREQFEGMLFLTEGDDLSSFNGLHEAAKESLQDFSNKLLEKNFAIPLNENPGFYFTFEGCSYQVRSSKYSTIKKKSKQLKPPLPILGMIR